MSDNGFGWLNRQLGIADTPEEREARALNAEQAAAERQRQREAARIFLDVFGAGRGPELLYLLREKTIEVPLMSVSRSIGTGEIVITPEQWAYLREGQNSVVRYIEEQLRIAIESEPVEERPAQTQEAQNG